VRPQQERNTVSLVIPTFDAASELPAALASIRAQRREATEVLVVDAGSTDRTCEIAREAGTVVLSCELGRGQQIASGIEAARGDWVVVLHADATLAAGAIQSLQAAAQHNPNMLGGAFGQRFHGAGPELLPIEVLNDMRALFSHTAFGDQAQFFHRASALAHTLMPRQPLMEDVESSWRVRESGEFVYLSQPCGVSHRKWHRSGWRKRFRLVIRLISKYRWARLRSRAHAEQLSRALYQEYYGSGK